MISEKESREEFEKWLDKTCTVKGKIDLAWEAWQGALNSKFTAHLHPPKTLADQFLNYIAGKACRDLFFPDLDVRTSEALRKYLKTFEPLMQGKGWFLLADISKLNKLPLQEVRNAAILFLLHGYLVNKPHQPGNTKVWKWRTDCSKEEVDRYAE